MSNLTKGAPIPSIIWSSLEDTLQANMRRLVKDIAATLGQPEGPLLQAIKSETIRPYLFEESADADVDMRCEFVCQTPETPLYIRPCARPVMWPTKRCAEHAYSITCAHRALPKLQALEPVEGARYFVSEDDTVYNAEYSAVGRYVRESKRLVLFSVGDA